MVGACLSYSHTLSLSHTHYIYIYTYKNYVCDIWYYILDKGYRHKHQWLLLYLTSQSQGANGEFTHTSRVQFTCSWPPLVIYHCFTIHVNRAHYSSDQKKEGWMNHPRLVLYVWDGWEAESNHLAVGGAVGAKPDLKERVPAMEYLMNIYTNWVPTMDYLIDLSFFWVPVGPHGPSWLLATVWRR